MSRKLLNLSASALALTLVCSSYAEAQQYLPTIEVGGKKKRIADSKPPARPQAPTQSAAASGDVAGGGPNVNSPGPSGPRSDLDTSLGPRIQYPTAPSSIGNSSSARFFTGGQVNAVPFQRPGDALEIIPGLAVTQHSGEGKANQYYLRGFDLDHGDDLNLNLDGMPLNMRSHVHVQGYADANFVMPELLSSVVARKGPYDASDGDFGNAGSIYMSYLNKVPEGVFTSTGGAFGYGRQFGMKSWSYAGGDILGAAEATIYNSPWVRHEDMRKINGVLRYSRGTEEDGATLTGMAYANRWYANDQLPQLAVDTNQMSRWGTMNPTDGGDTTRFSLSSRWSQKNGNQYSRVESYAMHSTLDLYNDFTYFLGQQNLIGDQNRQYDRRTMVGSKGEHGINYTFATLPTLTRVGYNFRYDDIRNGIQDAYLRTPYDSLTNNRISEGSIMLWTDTKIELSPRVTAILGAQWNYYDASVGNIQNYYDAPFAFGQDQSNGGTGYVNVWSGPFNTGRSNAQLVNPKFSLIGKVTDQTELFINGGRGFHSVDARSTVQNIDTVSADGNYGLVTPPGNKQPLLSPSIGAEIGTRTKAIKNLESNFTLFMINMQSELIYSADSGTTINGRSSRRVGIEFTNKYKPTSWLTFDGNLTATHSRLNGYDYLQAQAFYNYIQTPDAVVWGGFVGQGPGNYIPNAAPVVATAMMELGESSGWFSSFKYRYISPKALTEDGYFKSPAIGTVNTRIGYRWKDGWRLALMSSYMFNSRSDQIAYAYPYLIGTQPLFQACNGNSAYPTPNPMACAAGITGRTSRSLEPPAWRATFSGPLVLDPKVNNRPNLFDPITDIAGNDPYFKPDAVKWNGAYAGLNLGGGINNASGGNNIWFVDGLNDGISNVKNNNASGGGFLAGGQVGYNYQLTPLFVAGVETDFQGSTIGSGSGGSTWGVLANAGGVNSPYVPGWVSGGTHITWFGTVRGRGGITLLPEFLLYGTGGFAYAQVQRPEGQIVSNVQGGWTAGAGLEWMFRKNWSAKAEYLYANTSGGVTGIGNNFGLPINGSLENMRWSSIRMGLNYHMNTDGWGPDAIWGQPVPEEKKKIDAPEIAGLTKAPMWNGAYAGLNLGGGWGAGNGNNYLWAPDAMNDGLTNYWANNGNSGGVVGGGQIGYNYAIVPKVLIGAEADFQGATIGSGSPAWFGYATNISAANGVNYVPAMVGNGANIGWFGTVRGRSGMMVIPEVLVVYGTAGFAYANINRNYGGLDAANSVVQTGWTAGGGAEWMFRDNWSAKAEYLFTDVSGGNYNHASNYIGVGQNPITNNTRWNTIRTGVNYHLNFDKAEPVIAKY